MNAGRLERLQEAAGQPDRHNILTPHFAALAGLKWNEARLRDGGALQVVEQCCCGLGVAAVLTAEYVAGAGTVLQRNAPLPSRCARRGSSEGLRRRAPFRGYGHGTVAWQPIRPILEAGVQNALDEQSAHPRAIDEQISRNRVALM